MENKRLVWFVGSFLALALVGASGQTAGKARDAEGHPWWQEPDGVFNGQLSK